MGRRGIPFSEIYSVKELFEQPDMQQLDLNETISSEKYGGDLAFSKFPISFEKNLNAELTEPPLLGEHTEQVLKELLSYSEIYIKHLKDTRVI